MESVSVVVVPEIGANVIQLVPGVEVADHVSVPLPGLVTLKSFDAGLAPPCVPAKERLAGLKLRAGCAVTVKETVRV